MYAYYTLKNGSRIYVFLWDDILKGYDYRKTTTLYNVSENGNILYNNEQKIKIQKDKNNELFFEIDGEKKYFNDFDYYDVDELIKKLYENSSKIKPDDIAATFMKDTSNVGIFCVLPTVDFLIPDMAISIFTVDSPEKVLCHLSDKDYEKHLWSYKVTIEVADPELKDLYGTQIVYTSDLTNAIKFGIVDLVNINDYKKEKEPEKVLF